MTFQEIQELVKLLNKSNVAELKVEDGDFKLSIRTGLYADARTHAFVSAPAPAMPPPAAHPVAAVPAAAPSAAAPAPSSPDREKPAEAPPAKPVGKHLEIKSPMVGTFYRAPAPEKPYYVEVGTKVKKGDVICMIEAMKLFNEIESEISGTIVKPLVENAQPVEFDQVLFLVEPD